jgi:NADPH:quinone reductase-like Zn-dependent oxidoreductase
MRQDAEAMRRIGEYAEAGELTPPNVVAMRLDDAADAHRAHDANETPGKIVLEP